jgi:hypothetical protein
MNSKEIVKYVKDIGMAHFITTPYDHETNGVAERYNRTILTMALKDGGIPLMF